MNRWRDAWALLRESLTEWKRDDALPWGGALAFYSLFSIAPVLLIGIVVAGAVLGPEGVQARVLAQAEGLVGPDGARLVDEMVASAARGRDRVCAAVLGVAALLVGATTVFAQLNVAFNRMWDVRSTVTGMRGFLLKRVLAVAMVGAIGFLLLVSLLASAALSALEDWLVGLSRAFYSLLRITSWSVSFAVVTFCSP